MKSDNLFFDCSLFCLNISRVCGCFCCCFLFSSLALRLHDEDRDIGNKSMCCRVYELLCLCVAVSMCYRVYESSCLCVAPPYVTMSVSHRVYV